MKRVAFLLALMLAVPLYAQATGGDAPFANQQLGDPAQEAKARNLMGTLRCIQCQGQSIADSDAPIAGAMRSEVRQRIAEGETPEDIRSWLISKYGEWVSFEPPAHGAGLLLWLMPLILLGAGIWLARGLFKGSKP